MHSKPKRMHNKAATTPAYRRALFAICFLGGVFSGLASALAPSYLPGITADLASTEVAKAGAHINAFFIYGMAAGGIA